MEERVMDKGEEMGCRKEGLWEVVGIIGKGLHYCQVGDGGVAGGSWQNLRWEAKQDGAWGVAGRLGAQILPRERVM